MLAPAYLSLYPSNVPQIPTSSIEDFLDILSTRLGARLKGNEVDVQRTAKWFVKWWREGGALKATPPTHGWGFDFDFTGEDLTAPLEEKMERRVARFVEEMRELAGEEGGSGFGTSVTRERQMERMEKKKLRDEKRKANPGSKPRTVR